MKAQLLKKDGKPEFAVLPIAEYRRLLQRLEELEDIKDFRDYKRSPEESFPAAVVNRLLNAENPVRVWREYRGLTQSQLAEKRSSAALRSLFGGLAKSAFGNSLRQPAALSRRSWRFTTSTKPAARRTQPRFPCFLARE